MPHDSVTELTSQYVSRVASDLEHNAKEQDRVATEIAALQQQLTELQRDHTVLVNMREALAVTTTTLSATASPVKVNTAVPDAQSEAAATERSITRKSAPKSARTTLVELVRRYLVEQSEPRSAAEICTALNQAHPDREIKITVMRTTLENLVARNRVQRTKQGTSVFYSASRGEDAAGELVAETTQAKAAG